jgi:hypothetical protein
MLSSHTRLPKICFNFLRPVRAIYTKEYAEFRKRVIERFYASLKTNQEIIKNNKIGRIGRIRGYPIPKVVHIVNDKNPSYQVLDYYSALCAFALLRG